MLTLRHETVLMVRPPDRGHHAQQSECPSHLFDCLGRATAPEFAVTRQDHVGREAGKQVEGSDRLLVVMVELGTNHLGAAPVVIPEIDGDERIPGDQDAAPWEVE